MSCACGRLVSGKDLKGVCDALHTAAQRTPGGRLDELKGWTCHLALQVLHALAVVCLTAPRFRYAELDVLMPTFGGARAIKASS